jgi:hypothetical protein
MMIRLTVRPKPHDAQQIAVHYRFHAEEWHGAGNLHLHRKVADIFILAVKAGIAATPAGCEVLRLQNGKW